MTQTIDIAQLGVGDGLPVDLLFVLSQNDALVGSSCHKIFAIGRVLFEG